MPSRIGLMLDMSGRQLERVIYYEDYLVIDPGQTPLEKGQLLTENEYRDALDAYGEGNFEAGMGAEAIRKLLSLADLNELQKELEEAMGATRSKEAGKAAQARSGVCIEQDPPRVDGFGGSSSYPAGFASFGSS
jgi:DNA-directed RNA polymerase subunit beta'